LETLARTVVVSAMLLAQGPARAQATPEEDARGIEAGRAALARGEAQLRTLQFGAAADSLREGLAALESAFALLPDFHEILDGYLKLAAAYARLEREGEAERAMRAVVRLAPDLDLETGAYPALFIRRFHAARRRALSGSKGSLHVGAGRPARVRLDGREVGEVPVELEGVLPGPHFVVVTAVAPGGASEGYRVAVQDGQVGQVRAFEPVQEEEALKGIGEGRLPEPPQARAGVPLDLTAEPLVQRTKPGGDSVLLVVGLTVVGATVAVVTGYLLVNALNAAPIGNPRVHWSPP
jgi:hypothetical protein